MNTTKNPDGTYTVEFTSDERLVVDDVEATHGSDVLNAVIGTWLKFRIERFRRRNRLLFEEQFEALSSVKQRQVQDVLEGLS